MYLLIIFCIFVSVFSQIEPIEHIFRPLMYVGWSATCAYAILTLRSKIQISKFTNYFAFAYLIFAMYCLICVALGFDNLQSYYLQLLYIPLMMCFLGDCSANTMTPAMFQRICKMYVWASLLFSLWVHFTYFPSVSGWFNSFAYDFAQKNSASQIWGCAILVNMFLIHHKSNFSKQLSLGISLYFFFLIAVSHCRAAVLSLSVVLLYNIISYSRHKFLWFIFALMGVPLFFYSSSFNNFINHSLLLTKYEGMELDAFSSGRLGLYTLAWKAFLSSPIIGVGRYYVDCSYLAILAEDGIIGFILIESIWFYKIAIHFYLALKNKFHERIGEHTEVFRFLTSIIIFYLIESCLEGFPPFGPGVSSMAFWLLSSILLKRKDWIYKKQI